MLLEILALKELNKPVEIPQPKPVQTHQVDTKKRTPAETPRTYKIKKNDSLSKLSKRFRVPVSRLWAANRQLKHPDKIRAGEVLKIPHPKQKLKKRAMIVSSGGTTQRATTRKPSQSGGFSGSRGLGGANTYEHGSCTWWVKQWLPWVGSWGNANEWGYRSGLGVHSTPIVGSIAWSTRGRWGHVAVVIGVSGSNVVIREGNYDFKGSVRTNSVPTSSYQYLY